MISDYSTRRDLRALMCLWVSERVRWSVVRTGRNFNVHCRHCLKIVLVSIFRDF